MTDGYGWMKTKKGKVLADIGDGLRGPKTLDVEVHLPGYEEVEIQVRITLVGGAYQVSKVSILSKGDAAVSTELLRQIPLRTVVRGSVDSALRLENIHKWFDPKDSKDWVDEERFRFTALTYRRARLLGEAPTQAVMKAEGVSRSTASRRVAAARKAGYLNPDEAGQAGGARSPRMEE